MMHGQRTIELNYTGHEIVARVRSTA